MRPGKTKCGLYFQMNRRMPVEVSVMIIITPDAHPRLISDHYEAAPSFRHFYAFIDPARLSVDC